MAYNRKDHYFKKAKKQNFAARSIFKLEEIDQRLRLIRPGHKILDLGAAPGSWSQYCSKKIGPQGQILGVDLQRIQLTLPNAQFIQADISQLDLSSSFQQCGITPPFDLVISDMAPKTTGIKITDQARSLDLCQLAFDAARKFLKPQGHFICKLFHGADFEEFRQELRQYFDKIEIFRPKSTRKESKEIFLVALKFTHH